MAKVGRPGREVLEAVPVQARSTALRNRRIKAAYAKGWTQAHCATHYGITQGHVSVILRNPHSGIALCDV